MSSVSTYSEMHFYRVSHFWADRSPAFLPGLRSGEDLWYSRTWIYYISSINDRDYTMIIGTTIFAAGLFILAQLIIDIAYSLLDPRIRVQ